jgi:hypothetical protein
MPEIAYVYKNFRADAESTIYQARQICEQYSAQGYDLTLRQLYYQFVSRDLIPNKQSEYNRLGSVINDARLAGLLDWDYIVDRTRNLRGPGTREMPHWENPGEIIDASARSYRLSKWANQPYRIEVWIEKDALVGVLEQACPREDIAYFSCRGYPSQSEIWSAAQRLGEYIEAGQRVVILHLGDHDPSGIDMTRDIEDRLSMFISQDLGLTDPTDSQFDYNYEVADHLIIERIALNWNQIEQYNPPPNPAKLTDSRSRGYINRFGSSSWELDALEPTVLVNLIRNAVANYREIDKWNEIVNREAEERKILTQTAQRWTDVKEFLNGGSDASA